MLQKRLIGNIVLIAMAILLAFALSTYIIPVFRGAILVYVFQHIAVNRVETKNRELRVVVQNIVMSVEIKTGKKITIIYSPLNLANHIVERDGGVTGNGPVEGTADDALTMVACDYGCSIDYINENTILIRK